MLNWRRTLVVGAVFAGTVLAWAEVAAKQPVSRQQVSQQPANEQQMFDAIKQMLQSAHVRPQDMPKRILSVKPAGNDVYRVHVEMVQGDGWFELKWDGRAWQVRGINQ